MSVDGARLLDECLKQVPYTNQARVRADMLEVMSKLQTLYPKVGSINFTNGTKKQLLNMYGTIPMYYKGNKYNIPMSFWIPELYPQHAPMTFVSPTETMVIKPKHKHVDTQGRCYSPFLSKWSPTSHTMYALINNLSTLFNEDPPVYQKPTASTGNPSTTTNNSDNQSSVIRSGSFSRQTPTFNPSVTPPPSTTTNTNTSYNPPPSTQYNMGIATASHYATQQPQQQQYYNQQPVFPPSYQQQQQQQQPSDIEKLTQKVKDKLQPHMKELTDKINQDMEIQNKLNTRQRELTEQEASLEKELPQLLREVNTLKEREAGLDRWISTHENKEMDVDKMIEPEDMHSRQVLELLAEDNSIDDLVYVLGEALEKRTIDTETYLTRVRQLARDQFMKRALLKDKLGYKF